MFPLIAISKRQTCVSVSTPEAEIVAGSYGLLRELVPARDMCGKLLCTNVGHVRWVDLDVPDRVIIMHVTRLSPGVLDAQTDLAPDRFRNAGREWATYFDLPSISVLYLSGLFLAILPGLRWKKCGSTRSWPGRPIGPRTCRE